MNYGNCIAGGDEQRRDGFTLVELSIALVIIGLLIGGILSAQSMLSTSKIVSQAQQISQFDVAVMSFKTKYNFMPGDVPGLGGNGDGLLISCCGVNLTRFRGEIGSFWYNLNPDEFTNCWSMCQVKTVGSAKNVPVSKFGSPDSFIIASAIAATNFGCCTDPSDRTNYYAILHSSQVQTQVSSEWQFTATSSTNPLYKPSAVKPLELFALDKKIDDGLADAGYVLSGKVGGGPAGAIVKGALPI